MPSAPILTDAATSRRTRAGSDSAWPCTITRTQPGRSLKKIRPSGANTTDHGACSREATISTRYGVDKSPSGGIGALVCAVVGNVASNHVDRTQAGYLLKAITLLST